MGANYLMAEILRNKANARIDNSPNHLIHYKGNELRPVLLFALKWDCNTSPTSSSVISTALTLDGKTNSSAAIDEL
jgi:hypothetical protein